MSAPTRSAVSAFTTRAPISSIHALQTSTQPQPSEAGQQPHQTRRLTVATSQVRLPTLQQGCPTFSQHSGAASGRVHLQAQVDHKVAGFFAEARLRHINAFAAGMCCLNDTSATPVMVPCEQAYLSSPAALPPADVAAAGADAAAGSKDTSGPGRSMLPPGAWACEAFLEVTLEHPVAQVALLDTRTICQTVFPFEKAHQLGHRTPLAGRVH